MSNIATVICPYCGKKVEVNVPDTPEHMEPNQATTNCIECKKPIVVESFHTGNWKPRKNILAGK